MKRRVRFEAMYRAHAGAVLAYALRRTDATSAEDVLADVFLTAWRRLDDVPEDALPWLFGTARRVMANRRRGEARQAALSDRLVDEESRLDRGEASEPDARVIAALAALRAEDRELLSLIFWEGLEPRRVARALGVRSGTMAVRLHRARHRFARALAGEDARQKRTDDRSTTAEVT